jgi:hypothetical protein
LRQWLLRKRLKGARALGLDYEQLFRAPERLFLSMGGSKSLRGSQPCDANGKRLLELLSPPKRMVIAFRKSVNAPESCAES